MGGQDKKIYTIGGLVGAYVGEKAKDWAWLASLCQKIDEKVSEGGVVGRAI